VADSIVGTWELVSVERRASDGTVSHVLGEAPVGRLTYTDDGYMQAILMPGDRAMFESGDIYGTPEERQRGAENFVAYAGRYEQRGVTVFHYPDASYFPNWVGQELSRTVDLDGDHMTLATKPEKAGGGESAAHLIWQRRKL
jgi:hypothetical protein